MPVCLSAQLFPCSNMLYFLKCSCCILTLHLLSPGQCWIPLGSLRTLAVRAGLTGVVFAGVVFSVFSHTPF